LSRQVTFGRAWRGARARRGKKNNDDDEDYNGPLGNCWRAVRQIYVFAHRIIPKVRALCPMR
jgi:hypothetical protein